ncbi:MAG: hypothetical protein ACREQJ_06040, partial [Candidatus Binatia bacterium]
MNQAALRLEDSLDPRDLFARVASRPGVAFLDGGPTRSILAWDPAGRLEIDPLGRTLVGGARRAGEPIAALARFLDDETRTGRTVIGALSYDLRTWIEPRAGRAPRTRRPLAVLHAYDRVQT